MTASVVSVIVVSDYSSDSARSWDTERACFAGLAAQDFDEPTEFILDVSSFIRTGIAVWEPHNTRRPDYHTASFTQILQHSREIRF